MLRKNKMKKKAEKPENDPGWFLRQLNFMLHLISYVLVLSVISIALIFGYDLITQTTLFKAKNIEVCGLDKLSREQVLSHAGISQGVNIFSRDLEMIRKQTVSHPWIREAEISRIIPGGLKVCIGEHRPLAVIDLGEKFLINRQGILFKKMEAGDAALIHEHLPVVKGLTLKDIVLSEEKPTLQYLAVIEVLNLGQGDTALYPNSDIKSIIVDQETGLTMKIRVEKDARAYSTRTISSVRLGFGGYLEKYNILGNFIKKMEMGRSSDQDDFKPIDLVELNNSSRIVVKFANI